MLQVCILASTISHSYHSIITFGEWLIQTRETAFETVEHTVISGASLILVHSKRGTCMNTLSVLVAYGGCPYILTMHCPLTRLCWPCMWSDSYIVGYPVLYGFLLLYEPHQAWPPSGQSGHWFIKVYCVVQCMFINETLVDSMTNWICWELSQLHALRDCLLANW